MTMQVTASMTMTPYSKRFTRIACENWKRKRKRMKRTWKRTGDLKTHFTIRLPRSVAEKLHAVAEGHDSVSAYVREIILRELAARAEAERREEGERCAPPST
jgi:hypothetical protein